MLDEEDDNEPLDVDFSAKANLLYKLPTIDLLHQINLKINQRKICRKNIKVLEDTFNSFGIDVKVERAEIGPTVTKILNPQLVCVLTVFQTWQTI